MTAAQNARSRERCEPSGPHSAPAFRVRRGRRAASKLRRYETAATPLDAGTQGRLRAERRDCRLLRDRHRRGQRAFVRNNRMLWIATIASAATIAVAATDNQRRCVGPSTARASCRRMSGSQRSLSRALATRLTSVRSRVRRQARSRTAHRCEMRAIRVAFAFARFAERDAAGNDFRARAIDRSRSSLRSPHS